MTTTTTTTTTTPTPRRGRAVLAVRGTDTAELDKSASVDNTDDAVRGEESTADLFGSAVTDVSRLSNPAKIGCTSAAFCEVTGTQGAGSLDRYMRLPVEQYFVLDPNMIQSLGGNRFTCQIPRLNFFNLWIEPMVEVSVDLIEPDRDTNDGGSTIAEPMVRLSAKKCRIRGSPSIETLGLDRRFCIDMVVELQWRDQLGRNPSANPSALASSSGSSSSSRSDKHQSPSGSIRGTSNLQVWCEVVPPFHMMPRGILESTCSAVLSATVGAMFPAFLKGLGKDYEKWSVDENYRSERAARSISATLSSSLDNED